MKINRKYKKIILPILLLVIMGGIFLSGFYLGNSNRPLRNRQTLAYSEEARQAFLNGDRESFDFNLYFEVWNSIKSNHFSKNQIKERDLFYGSLEGLAGATDDPYTCLLYTSDAADDLLCVDLGGRRSIKKKKTRHKTTM